MLFVGPWGLGMLGNSGLQEQRQFYVLAVKEAEALRTRRHKTKKLHSEPSPGRWKGGVAECVIRIHLPGHLRNQGHNAALLLLGGGEMLDFSTRPLHNSKRAPCLGFFILRTPSICKSSPV